MSKGQEQLDNFLKAFPIERLKNLTIDEYIASNNGSFCHCLENSTQELGSVKSSFPEKFGIWKYDNIKKNNNYWYSFDDTYAWKKSSEATTAKEALAKAIERVIYIANKAKSHDFKAIEASDKVLGQMVKWKLAFIYSDAHLLPIYSEEKLRAFALYHGMQNVKKATMLQMQQFLLDRKGDKDVFEYAAELMKSWDEIKPKNKKTNAPEPANKEEKPIKTDFLADVFIPAARLAELKTLLRRKKNVILQGAPGVGKTFVARRLAYDIIGAKDTERVEMVQFHQNYTYEDFVQGYKPTSAGGFELRHGVFYTFCQKAAADPEHEYFFIIDEINRGNLGKVFGELFMLIEDGYRDTPVRMAYTGEEFCVPANLYILGMMNTADRSLAMLDYALRRRFAFFEIEPGFATEGFKQYQKGLDSERLDKTIERIEELNADIATDDALGPGFQIGHSYFCGQEEYSDEWLDMVLRYDIRPLLTEYYFDNPDKASEKYKRLDA